MKLRRAAALAAILGLVVPRILEEAFWRFPGPNWGGLFLLLWPSSLELRVFDNSPQMPVSEVAMIYAISIGINVILYGLIGSVAAFLYSRSGGAK